MSDSTGFIPNQADLEAIASKLAEVNFNLLAIHNLAQKLAVAEITDAQDVADICNAFRCMAKTSFRSLDACLDKLGNGRGAIGNFREEFEAELEEEASHD